MAEQTEPISVLYVLQSLNGRVLLSAAQQIEHYQ